MRTAPVPRVDAIIVGAGIAGLACAHRLNDADVRFLIVTEDVGGRMVRSRDGTVSLGAYYVRADYHHVNRYVDRGRQINRLVIRRHDERGSYGFWDPRLFLHLPQAVRYLRLLRRFRTHYHAFTDKCLTMSQASALRSDPFLLELYELPASSLVGQLGIEELACAYLDPVCNGTTFLPLRRLPAFTVLLGSLPLLVPIYEFSPSWDALLGGIGHAIRTGSVTRVDRFDDGFRLTTRTGETFMATNVVLATPIEVSRNLLEMPKAKGAVAVHMFEVAGRFQKKLRSGDLHLFGRENPFHAIVSHPDDLFVVCSPLEHPPFDEAFEQWELLEHRYWNPAFNLDGSTLLECEQAPNLFLVGDHNICGLEDAYLTGHHAANQIVERSRHRSSTTLDRYAEDASGVVAIGRPAPT